MRPPPRSEPVAEAKKHHLVDRCQDHIHNRLLDDLVLQRRDPERSCPPVRLGYLYPPNRRRPARSPSVQAPVQVEQALIQTLAVHVPRNAVDTGCCVLLQCEVGRTERVRRNVVEERSETFLRVSLCSFPYPGRRLWHAYQPVEKGVIDRVSRHGEAYRGEGGFAILRDDEDDLNDQDGSSGRNKHEQGANSARHGLLRGAGADELAHQQR